MLELHVTPRDDLRNILDNLTEPAAIYLKKGTYYTKVEIKKSNVVLIGEDRETTVITHDDYAKKIHKDGREFNTFRTYTVCVSGENVRMENLTIENSNENPEKEGQCVALSVNAKRFYGKNLKLKSMQDTLFMAPFPDDLVVRYRGFIPQNQLYMQGTSLHLFEDCEISGTVDFIFGGAEAYFKNCRIISRPESRKIGFVAAPCHHLVQERGFNFVNCEIINGGANENEVYLARPWRDFGKCAFINCALGSHVNSELFDKWNDTERDKTARFCYFGLKSERKLSPVSWAQELSPAQATEIINDCNAHFNDNNI
ncbi:MAG: pectin esterase [Clostridia bacterium]|nr:pectin esterase [Clostridia bacterium]